MYETKLTPELSCTNIKISLAFYVGVLGFNIQYQREEENFAMLERQGSRVMLDEIVAEKRMWLTGALEKPFGRGINLQIKTTDVDILYNNVIHFGADVFLPLEEKWYRADTQEVGNKQFCVLDPDGYMLRFYQDMGTRPFHSTAS
jgi:uncharacterized glyoxalase superfamily protein PhnB